MSQYVIDDLKQGHRLQMEYYNKQVRDFNDEHGYKLCDYFVHRLRMADYHRGAYNALNEIGRNDERN